MRAIDADALKEALRDYIRGYLTDVFEVEE